jgi:hypothetical protein
MPGRRNKNKIEESEADDITQLTNKELKAKLQDLGIATGPIVDSTRKIYEKKLEKLIAKGSDVAYSTDEDGEAEEPVQEENEETEDQVAEPVRRSNRTRKTESKSVVEDKFSDDEDDLPVVKNTSSRRRSARIQKSKNKTPEPEVETIEEEQQEETVEEEPVAEVKTEEVVVETVKEPNCVSKLYTALCNNFHTILFFVLLFVAGYLVYQERSAICALAGTISTNVVDAYTKFYYSMLPDIETIPEDATPKAEL